MADLFLHDPGRNAGAITLDDPATQESGGGPLKSNTFEGGTDGVTITTGNSGGESGDAFQFVQVGTDAVVEYDTLRASHGTVSAHIVAGATAANPRVDWTFGPGVDIYFRCYVYLPSSPALPTRLIWLETAGFALCGIVEIADSSGPKLKVHDGVGGSTTGAVAVARDQWIRIEGHVFADVTTGVVEAKLFNDPAATTPDETVTRSNVNTNTSVARIRTGLGHGIAVSNREVWFDSLAIATDAYIGPVAGSGEVTGSGAASLPAIQASGSGTVVSGISGSGTANVGPVAADGSGDVDVAGSGTSDLAPIAAAGAGDVLVAGSGTADIGPISASGSGTVTTPGQINGSGTADLEAIQAAGAGTVLVTAAGTADLGAIVATGSGAVPVSGTGASDISPVQASGAGDVDVQGSGFADLEPIQASGSGFVLDPGINGGGTLTLAPAQASGAGVVVVEGAGTASVPAVAASGSGSVVVAGDGASILPALEALGAGDVPVTGSGTAALRAIAVAGAGTFEELGIPTPVVLSSSGKENALASRGRDPRLASPGRDTQGTATGRGGEV